MFAKLCCKGKFCPNCYDASLFMHFVSRGPQAIAQWLLDTVPGGGGGAEATKIFVFLQPASNFQPLYTCHFSPEEFLSDVVGGG